MVLIEGLAAGGDGVGRLADGLTVFVPMSAPGDLVRVRTTDRRRRHAHAEIVEVIRPGPARVEPPCPVFGRCGGCAWQHIEYGAQVEAKRRILFDALRRIGRIGLEAPPSMTPSPAPYGYRSRARLIAQDGALGYRARRSHRVCAVRACPVLMPALESELADLADRVAASGDSGECEWALALAHDGAVASRLDFEGASGVAPSAGTSSALSTGGDVLRLSPGGFAQGNALLLESLHQAVLRRAGEGRAVLELHAGAGFFSLALARRFDAVQVVESSPVAVADLRRNLAQAGLTAVVVTPVPVEEALPDQVRGAPDVVVLDPPRAGLDARSPEAIARLSPIRIVYLSCDPATLSRDLARFDTHGYAVTSVEGFDLFPQTPHIEALAVLEPHDALE